MQSSAASTGEFDKANGSASKKTFSRTPSSMNQEQGDFSLELWKKAFRDAHERLCPLRASGHECGCSPVPARLVNMSPFQSFHFGAITLDLQTCLLCR